MRLNANSWILLPEVGGKDELLALGPGGAEAGPTHSGSTAAPKRVAALLKVKSRLRVPGTKVRLCPSASLLTAIVVVKILAVVTVAVIGVPAGRSHLVVGPTFGRIREDLVGFRHLLESFLRLLLIGGILVRVPFPGQLPVRLNKRM